MSQAPLDIVWLGRCGYRQALGLQEDLRRGVLEGRQRETVLLLEHPPVITLGQHACPEHVLLDPTELAAAGIEVVPTSRGGDVTYHGPGQLVAYPIVRLEHGVVAHIRAMAAAVVGILADYGIAAEFRRQLPGVWVGDGKICAFGVHVRHRIAVHGLAWNLTLDPRAFSVIVPCGLTDTRVTSLAELRPTLPVPSPELMAPLLGRALARELGRAPTFLPANVFPPLLSSTRPVE